MSDTEEDTSVPTDGRGDLPIVSVWRGMLAVPVIGMLDSDRTLQLTERLLNRIASERHEVALIDITGVATVDTPTAQHLIDLVSALRLLGTKVIITGIRPEVAQTLVHLGITLSDIQTESTLAAGIELGFAELGYEVVPVDVGRDEILT